MKLTQQQLEQFHTEGWLLLPELFNAEEVDLLRREAIAIYDQQRPEVWREKSGAPRTAFAAHLYNEAFRLLGAHPRMIEPIEQVFGEQVYMHQFKINAKSAFTGDVWQWHQDYGTWKRDDGMLEPRAMNIAIFLDEVMPINGPLMLVPRSQTAGDLKASHDLATTSYPLWTLDEETVTRLVARGAREIARVGDMWREATSDSAPLFLIGQAAHRQWAEANRPVTTALAHALVELHRKVHASPQLLAERHKDYGIPDSERAAIELLPKRLVDIYSVDWGTAVFANIDRQIEEAVKAGILKEKPAAPVYDARVSITG